MTNYRTLKEQNSKLLWVFFSFNTATYYFVIILRYASLTPDINSFMSVKNIWLIVAPLILFIANGIVSSNLKATICFWRIKIPLPGCRAFSMYVDKDDRIDKSALQKKYGIFPVKEKDQNTLWYKIYKSFQDDLIVNKSHKDFLLARDLCSIAFLFFLFGSSSILLVSKDNLKWIYLTFSALQYLILVVVAQNHGKRLVCNVLAIESSTELSIKDIHS